MVPSGASATTSGQVDPNHTSQMPNAIPNLSVRNLIAAALGAVAIALVIVSAAGHANANPTIPKPVNVQFTPGDSAKTLVVSWGDPPAMPNGCSYDRTARQIGGTNGHFEDSQDDHSSDASSHSYTSYRYAPLFGDTEEITYEFAAGTTYEAKVRIWARCGNSYPSSGTVSRTAVAPHSGPATNFAAATGTATGTIALSWTNPSGTGISVTKREYRAKLSSASSWPASWTQAGSSAAYTITGLTAGSNYDVQFRVQTNSVPTKTLQSDGVTAKSAPTLTAVSGFAATSGDANGEVDLSWTAVTNTTSYEYQSKKSTDASWGSWTDAGTGTSKTVTGLDALSIYEFKVRAKASSTTGAASSKQTAVAQFTPVASAAAGSSPRSIDLTITAPQGITITRYDVRWKLNSDAAYPTSGTGSWTSIATATSYSITGLTSATAYNVQVRVVHSSGSAASTNSLPETLNATASSAIKQPTTFTVVAGSQFGEVDLSWQAPSSQTVTRYEYRYREANGTYPTDSQGDAVWTAAGSAGDRSTVTSQTVTGLRTDGTTYDIELRLIAPSGNSAAVSQTAVAPKPLPAPTNFSAAAGTTTGSVKLSWTVASGVTATRYEYRWKLTSSSSWPTTGSTGDWTAAGEPADRSTASSANVTGLTANTSYDFQVRTVLGTGPSYSAPASASATSAAASTPHDFSAIQGTTPGSIQISWTDPTGTTITARQYRIKLTSAASFQASWTSAGSTSPFTITGLDAGEWYDLYFRVQANGGSSAIAIASASAGAVPPPTAVTATPGPEFGEITLSWSAPSGITPKSFRYRSKLATDDAYPNAWETASATSTSQTITGLRGNSEYDIQIGTVFRVAGRSSDSYSTPTKANSIAKPIPPPVDPQAEEAPTPGVVVLKWTPPQGVETHAFQYRYKPESGSSWSEWSSVPGHFRSTTVPGLNVGIQYQFQLSAQNGPIGGSPAVAFSTEMVHVAPPTGLRANGGVMQVGLAWDNPESGAATGYRYRYRRTDAPASSATSWSDWFEVELAAPDAEAQTTVIHGLTQATEYAVELTSTRGGSFSTPATALALTNVTVPVVGRIVAVSPAINVNAGMPIALEANVFDIQNAEVNKDADEGTGQFDGIQTRYTWSVEPSIGSFVEPANTRRVIFNAPDQSGSYLVTASILPHGICMSHYVPSLEGKPCTTQFTVHVLANGPAVTRSSDPTDPSGTIPTTLQGADGETYTVFTPVAGGTASSDGATLKAMPGAVPDNTVIGVRIAMAQREPMATDNGWSVATDVFDISAINAQGLDRSETQFNRPVLTCAPVPDELKPRIDTLSLATLATDGGITPIGRNIVNGPLGLTSCAYLTRLPATVAVVSKTTPATDSTASGAEATEVQSIDSFGDATLPDAGGKTPGTWLPLVALLGALAVLTARFGIRLSIAPKYRLHR